jgi:hypothetical protein
MIKYIGRIFSNLNKYLIMNDIHKISEIFSNIYDFCTSFLPICKEKLIAHCKKQFKPSKLSLSEGRTIQILFHLSGFITFKYFYLGYVKNTSV